MGAVKKGLRDFCHRDRRAQERQIPGAKGQCSTFPAGRESSSRSGGPAALAWICRHTHTGHQHSKLVCGWRSGPAGGHIPKNP